MTLLEPPVTAAAERGIHLLEVSEIAPTAACRSHNARNWR